jgi:ribosomal protein S18 acetylase RimI-like enzyme
MSLSFHPLDPADDAATIALWDRCGLLRPWNPPEADITALRAHPTADILVAKDESGVIASVAVGYDGHRGWVYYVATDPTLQGKGLGRAAMQAAEDWLIARDIPKIQLMVRESNAAVIGFYHQLGYEDSGVRVMQKWLSPERAALQSGAGHGG